MPRPARTERSGGFTLIEVLVSLVILSVGVLALGQLFWFSSRMSTDSYLRTMAHVQALDLGERMWLDLRDPLGQVPLWQADHGGSFSGWFGEATPVDAADPGLVRISVSWNETGSQVGTQYEYLVRLPVVSP